MLALQMGIENFTNACREFYIENKHSTAGLAEFKEIVSRHCDFSPDSFFTCWIDSSYSQNLSIKRVESRRIDSLYSNALYLSKSGKAESSVPVAIRYQNKEQEHFILPPGQLSKEWTSRSRISFVFIDPDQLILEDRRSDNAWPMQLKFHQPTLNLIGNIDNLISLISDEPGYHIYVLPIPVPSHSLRFGWNYSFYSFGNTGILFKDSKYNLTCIGYNRESKDLIYKFSLGHILMSSERGYRWNLFTEKIDGKYESGAGVTYGREANESRRGPFSSTNASIKISHQQFYRLKHVEEQMWPERRATPVAFRVSAQPFNIRATLSMERGLKVFPKDDSYYRYDFESSWSIYSKKKTGFTHRQELRARVFVGTANEDAAQRRFDPSVEGEMKSFAPFIRYYDHMLAANLLFQRQLFPMLKVRTFTNYVNPMTGEDPVYEFGLGLGLGPEPESLFGLTLDMPFYVSDLNLDNEHWSFDRFRIKIYLLSLRLILDFIR